MPTSPAVIFDLGKVLVEFDIHIVLDRLAPRCRFPKEALNPVIGAETDLLPRYETGRLTTEQFFQEAQSITGFDGTLEEFSQIFGDIFTPIPPMVQLLHAVRTAGYPTFIFSNTNDLAVRYISQFPFFKQFDDYILSYDHGSLKPDTPLYEVVEKVTRRTGEALIYMDDRPENVGTALARGWYAIQHQDPDTTREQLRQWIEL